MLWKREISLGFSEDLRIAFWGSFGLFGVFLFVYFYTSNYRKVDSTASDLSDERLPVGSWHKPPIIILP